jgi:hypothetical protein
MTDGIPKTLDESLKKAREAQAKDDRETRWSLIGLVALIIGGIAYLGVYFDVLNFDSACAAFLDGADEFVIRRVCNHALPVLIATIALIAYLILQEVVLRIIETVRR